LEKPVIREHALRRRNLSAGSYVPLARPAPPKQAFFSFPCAGARSGNDRPSVSCYFVRTFSDVKSAGKYPFPVGFLRIPVAAMRKSISCRQVHRRRNRFTGSYLPQPGSDSQNRPSFQSLRAGARPANDRPRN